MHWPAACFHPELLKPGQEGEQLPYHQNLPVGPSQDISHPIGNNLWCYHDFESIATKLQVCSQNSCKWITLSESHVEICIDLTSFNWWFKDFLGNLLLKKSENNHPLCYWATINNLIVLNFKFSVLTFLKSMICLMSIEQKMCEEKKIQPQSMSNVIMCVDQRLRLAVKNSGVSCMASIFYLSNLKIKFSMHKISLSLQDMPRCNDSYSSFLGRLIWTCGLVVKWVAVCHTRLVQFQLGAKTLSSPWPFCVALSQSVDVSGLEWEFSFKLSKITLIRPLVICVWAGPGVLAAICKRIDAVVMHNKAAQFIFILSFPAIYVLFNWFYKWSPGILLPRKACLPDSKMDAPSSSALISLWSYQPNTSNCKCLIS